MRLPSFTKARVAVVGDVMLDRYWSGLVARISPEAPVPVVHIQDVHDHLGGAANVALNLAQLGVQVSLSGVIGRDEAGHTVTQLLARHGISNALLTHPQHPTITKLRILSQHQQLLRLDFEQPLRDWDSRALEDTLSARLATGVEVLVLSDYAKGTLQEVSRLIALARARGIAVLVDPKSRDFSRYRQATLVTPNRAEFEAVVGHCVDEHSLSERGEALRAAMHWPALLITLGERGMLLLREHQPPLCLPTQAREVFDVTGAGDTVIAVLAACLACGEDLADGARLANLAAGIVVGKLGTAGVCVAELQAALRPPPAPHCGILDQATLQSTVADAKARGERIVMTNGCFDILHAGHVQYLQQAKALGDRLVVAVNDDASVQRLKGATRPVHSLAQRMSILSALACVDWVTAFSEDTPEALICALCPDVLVKGGDYRPEHIAGGDCVRRHGGQVIVLDFLPGHSTTALIDKIRGPA
ncbi:bifunctional D-glycero-beta-D-manno-heptose-7-phosphate kinase/D-glycero-beta-D-manno-heptose 1-phosphate adenylyltransferase HldE [Thiorhodospira sibirica]|uniref:bifunctional D-glycero-beta-D-manno-heptose-7-phosphate kinase/D-glycero-beta-D-manno-heptose 1-phosphate adenylyltransferase HldE n=1 Tax=Thiorhodospira sibirica TaxID=154347 RepID=UPI00022C1106|nr:bifunctional D-glycero-beta-D-manno-heptose-7-phosphate kinase/D-glycero-beta-D-manno-heptose 1-phosphate adenylyltransferase HldE [Thiorhodospira sibirica]